MSAERSASDEAITFLEKVYPVGPWCLSAIKPDKKGIETRTFYPDSRAECLEWITKFNGTRNLYWQVNPVIKPVTKKAERADIASVNYLHVDVDPGQGRDLKTEQERILKQMVLDKPKGVPEPTIIIFSGGGYQAFWKLTEPLLVNGDLEIAEDLKRYNQRLELLFGGDNCHDISRLMRLPCTLNIPDPQKVAKGRTPIIAKVIQFRDAHVYDIVQFEKAVVEQKLLLDEDEAPLPQPSSVAEVSELAQYNLPDDVLVIMAQGHDPNPDAVARKVSKTGKSPTRSEWLFHFVCSAMRGGVPEEKIMGILLDKGWGISESVLDKGRGARRYAERQIRQARKAIAKLGENKEGKVERSARNFRVILAQLGIEVTKDTFADRVLITGLDGYGPELTDEAVTRIRVLLEERTKWMPGKEWTCDMLTDAAERNRIHPVCDYLDKLSWDRVPRLDTMFIDHLGVEDTSYTRAVARLWAVAAVRRVRHPGCKFDEMPVLHSDQGMGKSTFLSVMAVNDDWFTDSLSLSADPKEVIEQTQGKWIAEIAELSGSRRADVEHIKAMLSRSTDRGRPSYGRFAIDVPRQFVIVGTTNPEGFLKDSTGNRRYWPLTMTRMFDMARLKVERDQLWAEAAYLEAQGCSIRLDPALYAAAGAVQAAHKEADPWCAVVEEWLGDEQEGKLSILSAYAMFGIRDKDQTVANLSRLRNVMQDMGWLRHKQMRFGMRGVRMEGFWRGPGVEGLPVIGFTITPEGKPFKTVHQPDPRAVGRVAMATM